jgi:hypothetical protein
MNFLIVKYFFYNKPFTQPGIEFSFTKLYKSLDGMETYLLLRSNKQSGPYSLQQLVNFGLKPYDLVWVEGKSAAWRYPSEVELLKAYAPAVEEQPYDRFYKKQEETPAVKPVPKQEEIDIPRKQEEAHAAPKQQELYVAPRQEEIYVAPKEENLVLPVENKTVTTTKKVFVSMPQSHVAKKPVQPVQVKAPNVTENRPVIVEDKKVESKPILVKEEPVLKEKPVWPKDQPVKNEKIISFKEEPILNEMPASLKEEATLNEKYSESLDDIKRRYTETYLSRKKKTRWTSTHTSLAQVFGGAIFFCLLVVFAYKNFSGEEQSQSRTTLIQPDKRSVNTGTTTTTTPTTIPAVATETNKQQEEKRRQTIREKLNPPDESESVAINTKQQKNEELDAGNEVIASEYEPEKKAVMTKSAEEIKPEPVKPKTRPVNFNRLVNVTANNYKQRAFGGVMNLELTVNNDSKYDLDKVVVELQYLKPSEQPIKTERIVFNAVEANGSQTLKIPDYLRGVKVAYRVTGIESSQYERQTAGL